MDEKSFPGRYGSYQLTRSDGDSNGSSNGTGVSGGGVFKRLLTKAGQVKVGLTIH